MKTLPFLPSNPTIDIFIKLADLYHNNKLTPTDMDTIKAKYPIGTIITINGVQYWVSDYEQGKSEIINQKDVPFCIFASVKVYKSPFFQLNDNILCKKSVA